MLKNEYWICKTCHAKKTKPLGTYCSACGDTFERFVKADEVERLNCNEVECHQGIDILSSVYAAMNKLPCNGVQAILCGAAQEIQALRDDKERLEGRD